jgi:hypothetical protein
MDLVSFATVEGLLNIFSSEQRIRRVCGLLFKISLNGMRSSEVNVGFGVIGRME